MSVNSASQYAQVPMTTHWICDTCIRGWAFILRPNRNSWVGKSSNLYRNVIETCLTQISRLWKSGVRYLRVGPFAQRMWFNQSIRLSREYTHEVEIFSMHKNIHPIFRNHESSRLRRWGCCSGRDIRLNTKWPVEIIPQRRAISCSIQTTQNILRIFPTKENNKRQRRLVSSSQILERHQQHADLHVEGTRSFLWMLMIGQWKRHTLICFNLRTTSWLNFGTNLRWSTGTQPKTRLEARACLSGGIDSAAAMGLMPEETVLLYNERTGIPGQLNHTNAFRFFENYDGYGKNRTEFRQIMNNYAIQGKSVGFSTDYACALQVIWLITLV